MGFFYKWADDFFNLFDDRYTTTETAVISYLFLHNILFSHCVCYFWTCLDWLVVVYYLSHAIFFCLDNIYNIFYLYNFCKRGDTAFPRKKSRQTRGYLAPSFNYFYLLLLLLIMMIKASQVDGFTTRY